MNTANWHCVVRDGSLVVGRFSGSTFASVVERGRAFVARSRVPLAIEVVDPDDRTVCLENNP